MGRVLFLFVFVFLVVPGSPVFSQVVINEIYYDHPGLDNGHEYVELFNTAPAAVSLAGSMLEFHDGASVGWRVIWTWAQGDSIAGESLLVVGGNAVTPLPDYVAELALQNGPDALRVTIDGVITDRVGYGALADPEYYEGESAPDAPEGRSLARFPDGQDTNNNALDFRVAEPSPGRFNRPRRNIAVTKSGRTPVRRAVDEEATESLRVFVVNRGVSAASGVSVVLRDSTESGDGPTRTVLVDRAIADEDSVEIEFAVTFARGYHWIRLSAEYDGDERPADNHLELLRRAGDPSMLISEIMSYPRDGCPEYVELYNSSAEARRPSELHLRDRANDPVFIHFAGAVPPGGYVVVTDDKALLLACFPGLDSVNVVQSQGRWPSLNHSGSGEADSVVVVDRFFLGVDRVAYPPQATATRGRSVERVDLYPGVRQHVWLLSIDASGGSPGRGHGQTILEPSADRVVSVHPNPFDLGGEGRLVITVGVRREPTRARVQIFDVNGRLMRDVGSTQALPFVFVWDGKNEAGQTIPSGIYLLACELYGLTSGSREVERVVLGCGRGNH